MVGDLTEVILSEDELLALVGGAFVRLGVHPANAVCVATTVVAAERDGAHGHGLMRMPGYVNSLRSGAVDGAATPTVTARGQSAVLVDGRSGFAQVALAAAGRQAEVAARAAGSCVVSIRNVHHYAALWPDVEGFAERGLVALTMVNTRPHMAGWGSKTKVFGTNPVAFACPRTGGPPLVWDQASSMRSQGEVMIARDANLPVPEGTGIDADGLPTTDPGRILGGGALLPFGGAKGANMAFMVEIMVAALGGSAFGMEVPPLPDSRPGTSRTGQFLLLLDPAFLGQTAFASRVEGLLGLLEAGGVSRLPAERRYQHRKRSRAEGISLTARYHSLLVALASGAA